MRTEGEASSTGVTRECRGKRSRRALAWAGILACSGDGDGAGAAGDGGTGGGVAGGTPTVIQAANAGSTAPYVVSFSHTTGIGQQPALDGRCFLELEYSSTAPHQLGHLHAQRGSAVALTQKISQKHLGQLPLRGHLVLPAMRTCRVGSRARSPSPSARPSRRNCGGSSELHGSRSKRPLWVPPTAPPGQAPASTDASP